MHFSQFGAEAAEFSPGGLGAGELGSVLDRYALKVGAVFDELAKGFIGEGFPADEVYVLERSLGEKV